MTAADTGPSAAAADVPSPCTQVCTIDPRHGWCAGCWRSLDEIAAWSALDDAAKRAVWLQLAPRRDAAFARMADRGAAAALPPGGPTAERRPPPHG